MQKTASLLINGPLEAPLGRGICWQVTDPSSSDIVLGKRINQPFANFGCLGNLCG